MWVGHGLHSLPEGEVDRVHTGTQPAASKIPGYGSGMHRRIGLDRLDLLLTQKDDQPSRAMT
jgi:hypothetical protein